MLPLRLEASIEGLLRMVSACAADALCAPARLLPDVGIRLIKGVAVLAMGLSRVALELHYWRTVQVLCVRLHNEMGRVHARAVGASMAKLLAIVDNAVREDIRHPVCQPRPYRHAVCSRGPKVSVAVRQAISVPGPTSIWSTGLVYFGPEAERKWPDHHFRALVGRCVAMSLPSAVMHTAPTALLNRLRTVGNRTVHGFPSVSSYVYGTTMR